MKAYETSYEGIISKEQLLKDETLFHIANGYLGKKGVFTEGYGYPHKRGLYVNGFYNTYPYHYEENASQFPKYGKTIMSLPDASLITIEMNGCLLDLTHMHHIKTSRSYDISKGITKRTTLYEDPNKGLYRVDEIIYAHLHNLDNVNIEFTVTPLSRAVHVTCHHHIQMPYVKELKERDPRVAYEKKHLTFESVDLNNQTYHFETISKQFTGSIHFKSNLDFKYDVKDDIVTGKYIAELNQHQSLMIELSLKYRCNHPHMKDVDADFDSHLEALKKYQEHQPVFFSDQKRQRKISYLLYQLYHAGGVNKKTSIAAKGLSGEGYEGHYFWDTEVYMLPFFIFNFPEKARRLIEHRMIHVEAARHEAANLHVSRGIKIPWRSIDGTELSPYFLAGSAQIHINSDIAYALILYVKTTNDTTLLLENGFRFIVELGLYILTYGFFDDKGFHLMQVTGPDEYTALVDDNYYTNSMARFHFQFIVDHFETYQDLVSDIFDHQDLKLMKKAIKEMAFYYDENLKLYLQDASHHMRKPLSKNIIHHSDTPLMLRFHPHFIYRHQVLKQADSVAADVLLNRYDDAFIHGFSYYLDKTTHDSSLSKCMYGIGAYQLGKEKLATQFFEDTLSLDLEDKNKHTKNGLHFANIGGSYLMVLKGIFGVDTLECLSINPTSILNEKECQITFKYHDNVIKVSLNEKDFNIQVSKPIQLKVYGEHYMIENMKRFLKKVI